MGFQARRWTALESHPTNGPAIHHVESWQARSQIRPLLAEFLGLQSQLFPQPMHLVPSFWNRGLNKPGQCSVALYGVQIVLRAISVSEPIPEKTWIVGNNRLIVVVGLRSN